jgi:hypothetical protein
LLYALMAFIVLHYNACRYRFILGALKQNERSGVMKGLTDSGSRAVYVCSDGVWWLRDRLFVVASEVDGAPWFQGLTVIEGYRN